MSDALDPDALAEARLDGDIDDARWRELEAAHGPDLAAALARARALRGAVAAFERPPLPSATRAAITGAAQPSASPASAAHVGSPVGAPPLRFPWRVLLPTALAAALVIAFVATLSDPSAPDRSALARREAMPDASADAVTSAPAPTSGKRSQLALDDEAPAAPRAMESEAEADRALATADGAGLSASSGSDTRTSGTRAESLEGVRSDTSDVAILAEQRHGVAASSDPGEGSAPPAEPPSARSALRKGDRGAIAGGGESVGAPPAIMAKPAAKSAPGVSAAASDVEAGIDERLAGVQAGADAASATDDADDADYAALLDEARAFGAAPTEATEATPAPSPLGLSLAWSAPAPAAQIVTDQAGDDGAAAAAALVAAQPASRVATLTLRNGTVGDMLLPAGSLALHGYDRAGRAIWQSPVRAERDTELPGGGTISWQEIVDAPPEVVEVRVHWGPHRSEPIALAR